MAERASENNPSGTNSRNLHGRFTRPSGRAAAAARPDGRSFCATRGSVEEAERPEGDAFADGHVETLSKPYRKGAEGFVSDGCGFLFPDNSLYSLAK